MHSCNGRKLGENLARSWWFTTIQKQKYKTRNYYWWIKHR